ncbi:hypothetical protein HRI_002750700 [Hibiscus trionum]|uniref:Uncharacterized protein n=1 Tax=Hibiscus trionum TaxID=183268 RepID=A0A9W7M7V7_HIBTR|nr:hypothetical protein HRI_002750700 [Hibiscus trionum]
MQAIKTKADELVTLGKPLDAEDLIEKVLDGLDDSYQPVIDVVNNQETLITFDELHEKLINRELSLNTVFFGDQSRLIQRTPTAPINDPTDHTHRLSHRNKIDQCGPF